MVVFRVGAEPMLADILRQPSWGGSRSRGHGQAICPVSHRVCWIVPTWVGLRLDTEGCVARKNVSVCLSAWKLLSQVSCVKLILSEFREMPAQFLGTGMDFPLSVQRAVTGCRDSATTIPVVQSRLQRGVEFC